MALEIRRPRPAVVGLVADRRLYLTRDESKMVEHGSPDAAFLLATPGTVVPADLVDRLGLALVDGCLVQRPEPEPLPDLPIEEMTPDPSPTPPKQPPKRARGA